MGVPPLSRRGVFIDRDGVLNRALADSEGQPSAPRLLRDLELVPNAAEACARLRMLGFVTVIVTNQPDLARGQADRATIDLLNRTVAEAVGIHDVLVCPHDDRDDCECRKPKPGLILKAAHDHSIDPRRSYMVGDRWRDIEAGRRAGCRTIFVDNHWPEPLVSEPEYRVASLLDAVDLIEQLEAGEI